MSTPHAVKPSLKFQSAEVTPTELITAARHYTGYLYSASRTWEPPAAGRCGFCDCVGLFLLAARRVGWLAPDFPVALPYSIFGKPRAKLLRELLETNCLRMPFSALSPGDVVFVRYADQPDEGRHIALLSVAVPGPEIIHAWCDLNGYGRVLEEPLWARNGARLRSIWRPPYVQGGRA